jgi:hypothetical protein
MTIKTAQETLIEQARELGVNFTLELSDDKNEEYLFLCNDWTTDSVKLWLTRDGLTVDVYPVDEVATDNRLIQCRDVEEVCNIFKVLTAYRNMVILPLVREI